jgi:hypothetical protein
MKTSSLLRMCCVAAMAWTATGTRAGALTSRLELTTLIGSSTYRVEAETPAASHGSLEISCLSGCKSHVDFKDIVTGIVMEGAFTLGQDVVTVWAIGDGGLVVVYHVDAGGVHKVLETPTRGMFPVPTVAADGQPAFIIQGQTAGDLIRDQEQGIVEPSHPVQGDLWVWNGQKYVMAHK